MDEDHHQLEKMAALGRVTRALIHDFNNSLASIMGHADFLIADLPEGSEQHLFAENIKRASVQLQDSLDQIRKFSADAPPESPKESSPSPANSPSIAKSILLVEDREMVLNTITTMLQRDHHQVESVSDGFTALDKIRENPKKYDLLITDYFMPELNGKDLLAEIRQDFKNLPIIVMSGDEECLNALKNDKANKHIFVLQKPINAQDLKSVVAFAQNSRK